MYLVCSVARQNKTVPEYLSFTRKERTGIVVIFILITVCIVLPFLFPLFIHEKPVDHAAFEKEIAALNTRQDSTRNVANRNFDENNFTQYRPAAKNEYSGNAKGALFYFDPNILPAAGWVKLGIREKTANTIQNYTSKGGRFNKPEDIGKIWGLREDDVKRLLPYVRITEKPSNKPVASPSKPAFNTYEKPVFNIAPVDINEADTSAFIALPGIGSKLANRIVAFREKLGGFYKVDQVAETFALPDSVFRKIRDKLVIHNTEVKKININSATADELKVHPYIRYNIANAIVQYRALHGSFATLDDLKKIMIITEDLYLKASPYLTVK
jgi:competence protein ComEA